MQEERPIKRSFQSQEGIIVWLIIIIKFNQIPLPLMSGPFDQNYFMFKNMYWKLKMILGRTTAFSSELLFANFLLP